MRRISRRGWLAGGAGAVLGTVLLPSEVHPRNVERTVTGTTAELLARVRTPKKQPALVLEASYQEGAFDALAVDCPFVFRHDGRFYMAHIGFDGVGYRTGLASSSDLLHWRKEGLLIDRGPKGSVTEFNVALTWILRDNDLFGPGTLRKVDGRFLGTYHAYPRPGYEAGPAVIGLCRSDDLRSWELDEPFLHASDADAGDWERGGLYKSCLLEHDGRYYLFYNAKYAESPHNEQTGLVVSDDLKHWRRHDANPLVRNGPAGAVDDRFCSDPCVLRVGGTWLMFYFTLSTDGHARDTVAFSKDLVHWEKSNEILIDVGPEGSIDSRYAHKPSVFAHEGLVYHFYCAVAPPKQPRMGDVDVREIRGIALATS
ncbi:MAG: hypothetical protein GWP08_05630 [Nitrospiraceae bacterium]|nr:hypothetical protein [Nitrospiraceae bacterium]